MKQKSKFSKDLFRELPAALWRMNKEVFRHVPKTLVIAYAASVIAGSLTMFLWRYVEALLVNHIQSGVIATLVPILVAYAVVRLLPNWISELDNRLEQRSRQKISAAFQHELIRKKGNLDVAYFETSKFHDELNNAEQGTASCEQMFVDQIGFMNQFVAMTAGLIALSFIGWGYAVVIVISTVPSFVNMVIRDAQTYEFANSQRPEKRKRDYFSGLFGINTIVDLKIFQLEDYFLKSWNIILKKTNRETLAFEDKKAMTRVAMITVSSFGVGWVIYAVVMKGIQNHSGIGIIMFALGGIGVARASIFDGIRIFARMVSNLRYVHDYFQVFDAKPFVENSGTVKIILDRGPEIEFRNVSFRYQTDGPDVLNHVSFHVLPGQKIGIAGINGSGKSTLMNLLMRFYDPTEGIILINGNDLRTLDLDSYRKYVGFVTQKISLPKAHSIREIIEMGGQHRPGSISDYEWERMLQHSGVADFLPNMKNGIDQIIGKEFEGGTRVSGGQEQRIAIARVLYRKPMMYVFDEPTSNFDPLIEDRFFTAFNALPKQATSFLISHSLRIVRKADQILVFDHGTIAENGTHHELLSNNGLYSQMFYAQSKDYMPCHAEVD